MSTLNLGMDYDLQGVSIRNAPVSSNKKTNLGYSSHRVRVGIGGWLNEDVETALKVQSINIWGLEGDASSPATRYPSANGTPWIEQIYIHLPHLVGQRLDLTLGRQPLVIGDGTIVSDDQRGFNALRAKLTLPRNLGLDLFTAKTKEGLEEKSDSDLTGLVGTFKQEDNQWELSWIREDHGKNSNDYSLGGSTTTVLTDRVEKSFYDLRLFGDKKDAYYKLEVALAKGSARLPDGRTVQIDGLGEKIELGAQADTIKFGRFGVKALFASGSGDDPSTPNTDESFNPTFAKRWGGLQPSGWGKYFGASLGRAYNPSLPFAAEGTGLPAGASGIKTLGFGIFTVQRIKWTVSMDYYTYASNVKVSGQNKLGDEWDLGVAYRHTGFLNFHFGAALFSPGEIYGSSVSSMVRYTATTDIHF